MRGHVGAGAGFARRVLAFALTASLGLAFTASVRSEEIGRVLTLPGATGPHWFWIGDGLLRRAALVNADDGRFLGTLSAGIGTIEPSPHHARREIYLPETHYSRGTRGVRTDVVTVYDATTLAPVAEVEIPPKRAEHASGVASSALSDDGRFLAVFNLTPATSLSIVDVEARRFTSEIATPGCSLVYPAGDRRFAMLCGDGTLMAIEVDDAGVERSRTRSERFFDPIADPVTEKAARYRASWNFVSFEGWLHPVDLSSGEPALAPPWSLFSEADRAAEWRVGGAQHLTVYEPDGLLYALVHQGGPDTHKKAGTEVWVYDLEQRERVARIELRNPVGAFALQQLELEPGGVVDWLLQLLPSPGLDRILVTQDADPVLIAAGAFPAAVSVYDARSGEFLRDLEEVGMLGTILAAP